LHRVVKDFIVQGGDPTGTGDGGESAYGSPFIDEFHPRLRFNRRGLVGMANSGSLNTNTSQFFITLNKTEELQGKNTLFGKVVGDTIFNALKVQDLELDNERPIYPPKIERTEVIHNPFDDIKLREKKRKLDAPPTAAQQKSKSAKIKGTKNLALLSFVEDSPAQMVKDDESDKFKLKSAYHFVDNPVLKKEAEEQEKNKSRISC